MPIRDQAFDGFHALSGAFFVRFFESEITTGADDLKGAFFWLLAALAVPGLFIPWMMAFDWHLIGAFKGHIALREASRAEKAFYVGFAMIASGMLTAIAWSSLLPDRRDTLILGTLPVRPATVVAAKLAALAGYILLVAVSMHTLAAVFFGMILSTNGPGFFALRGIAAHFAASCAASAAVALTVAAAQGLTLALAGPRLFRRLSPLLQACLVGAMAAGLALLPPMTSSIVHTLRGFGINNQPWLMSMPPVWFVGLYEWILGSSDPVIIGLAAKAAAALLIPLALTAITYPIVYRRLMMSVVDAGSGMRRGVAARVIPAILVRAAGRHPGARAAADFFLATLGRVERHRFVIAIALGIALAWALPGLMSFARGPQPPAALLSLPLAAMMFLITGLRIASSLPGDVRAGWVFDVHSPSRRHARQALERTIFLLGVAAPALLSLPVFWWFWGATVALVQAGVILATGLALIEWLIWHAEGMPCGQQWIVARANPGRRWPLFVAVFLLVSTGVPALELLLFPHRSAAAVFIGALLLVALVLRHRSARHQIVPSYEDIDPVAGVLRLN